MDIYVPRYKEIYIRDGVIGMASGIEGEYRDKLYGGDGRLKYDSDWNWLMKAVDMVEQLSRWWRTDTIPWSYNTDEIRYQVFVQQLSGGIVSEKKIDAYYLGVVAFIEYYNDIQMED